MRTAISLLLTMVVLGGCGDDQSPEDACHSWVSTTCNKLESCSEVFLAVTYGSVERCVERLGLVCAPVLAASGVTLSAGDFSACAEATSAESCGDLIADVQPAACRIAGSLADGKACGSNVQCASAYCKKSGGSRCGVCGQQVTAGEACGNDEDCLGDLACRQQVCVKYGEAGGTCDGTHPCRPPLVCAAGGTCAKPGDAGDACDPLRAGACDLTQGLYCGLQSKVCEKAGLAGDGEPCGVVGGAGFTVCTASGRCKVGVGSVSGTCQAAAADGQSCDSLSGPDCLPPASCDNGICKLDDPAACK